MKHVYAREIDEGANDSLAIIARQFGTSCHVLDVGTGTGALGRYLKARGCTVLGITYSEEEAQHARDSYDRLETIDLERVLPSSCFSDQTFDVIVCADILEHLRNASEILRDLRGLLSPDGRLLLSIPNATYMGVLFGLLGGRFQRTQEGLLDATHVNFFDRRGLESVVHQAGFRVANCLDVHKGILDSEFSRLDVVSLPSHVRQYVASLPDADVYQFVWELVPSLVAEAANSLPVDLPQENIIVPQFDAQLFWDVGNGFDESASVHARGVVSEEPQVLRFDFELPSEPLRLRVDLGDRPGTFEFFSLKLFDDSGAVVMAWMGDWFAELQLNDCEILPEQGCDGGRLMRATSHDPWVCVPASASWKRARWAELKMSAPQLYRDAAFLWAERHSNERIRDLEQTVSQLTDRVQRSTEKAHGLELERLNLIHRSEALAQHIAAIESSTSWRVTAGLRWLSRILKKR